MIGWLLVFACGTPGAPNPFAVDDDGDGWSEFAGDCDDSDPDVGPAEGDSCADIDGDHFYARRVGGLDCNDLDPFIHPFALEDDSNAIDEDCDGYAPQDIDGDGFRSISTGGSDCDDSDADISPAATEDYTDDIDSDCNGIAELDLDGDGYISDETGGNDCDDDDAAVNPGAAEDESDLIDNDCDGEAPVDLDGDGYLSLASGGDDCDDTDRGVNPGAEEICGNGIDDDCEPIHHCNLDHEEDLEVGDLLIDGTSEGDGVGTRVLLGDLDGDGVDDLYIGGADAAWLLAGPLTTGSLWVGADATWTTSAHDGVAVLDWGSSDALMAASGDAVWLWSDPLTLEPLTANADARLGLPEDTTATVLLGADLDGDGVLEAVAADPDQGGLSWWPLLGSDEDVPDETWTADEGFGASLATGDLDGDGYDELLVGSPFDDTNGTDAGAVFVFAGPVSQASASTTWLGPEGSELGLGTTLVAGDLSGDGDDDLVLAGPALDRGLTWVVPAASTGTLEVGSEASAVRYGYSDGGRFGIAMASADVDGDGADDLLVGSPAADFGAASTGVVTLFFGPLTGSVTVLDADVVLEYNSADAQAGASVGIGDLDDDGIGDLVVGVPGGTVGSVQAGQVAVVREGPGE